MGIVLLRQRLWAGLLLSRAAASLWVYNGAVFLHSLLLFVIPPALSAAEGPGAAGFWRASRGVERPWQYLDRTQAIGGRTNPDNYPGVAHTFSTAIQKRENQFCDEAPVNASSRAFSRAQAADCARNSSCSARIPALVGGSSIGSVGVLDWTSAPQSTSRNSNHTDGGARCGDGRSGGRVADGEV